MPNQKRSGTHPASCTFSVAYCRLSPSELQSCSYPLVMCAAVVALLLALAGCAQEQPVETSAAVEVVSGEKKPIPHARSLASPTGPPTSAQCFLRMGCMWPASCWSCADADSFQLQSPDDNL